MGLMRVPAGREVPEDVNVIIEISAHSEPIKYEVDKNTGALFVDRFMGTPMRYPCDYGYIPQTLCQDGDPVDVLIITPFPVSRGCVLRCRPVGMLLMEDEEGPDAKILAVPIEKLTPLYNHVKKPEDLPELLLKQIIYFFEHYKDLEPGKWVKLNGFTGAKEAKVEILHSIERYKNLPDELAF
ncbi:MAG TPA: inorganic diphosphatase [Gammaproteobacteria bacterium]|nr:inorganic diphosphatase [Gammaproteobacteria bacterium]